MTDLERAILHIKTRADAWAVKEVKKALSQEPCDNAVSREAVIEAITQHMDGEDKNCKLQLSSVVEWIRELPTVNPQPCDDAISRDMALEKMADYVASGYADSAEDFEEYSRIICQLPSVTQKSGKWIAQDIHNCHTDFKCSECGYIHSFMHLYGKPTADYTYCPNCGAKMESEDKE